MKRFLLILTLVIISLISNAQKDSTLVTNSEVERLVDKYSAKIEASITTLAETLQQPAEFVYEIMVRQQYVKSISALIPWFFLILSIPLLIIGIKNAKWKDNFFIYEVITIIGFAMFAIALAKGLTDLQLVIQGFVNPDYGAIQDIADLFK